MKIYLNDYQANLLKKAIKFSNLLFQLKWNEAFLNIEPFMDKPKVLLGDEMLKTLISVEKISEAVAPIEYSEADNVFEIENVRRLEICLDLITRLALGQWENLYEVFNFYHEQLGEIFSFTTVGPVANYFRNIMYPEYQKFKYGSSYGIHCEEVHKEVRVIYDIYKKIMFEDGVGGCYRYEPSPITNQPNPRVVFPYKESFLVTKDFDWGEYFEKHNLPKIDGEFWLPTAEYFYGLAKEGDIVNLRKNNFYEIIRKEHDVK